MGMILYNGPPPQLKHKKKIIGCCWSSGERGKGKGKERSKSVSKTRCFGKEGKGREGISSKV